MWGLFERPGCGVRILGEVVECRLAARESAGSGEGDRRECLRQPYRLRRHGRAVVHETGGVAQRIRRDAVGKGQVEERFGQLPARVVAFVRVAVIPVRQRPCPLGLVVDVGEILDRRPDHLLEPIQVHAVPRPEEPAAVLALVTETVERVREHAVDGGLVIPAGRVRGGALLHDADAARVGIDGRVPVILLVQCPDVVPHIGNCHRRGGDDLPWEDAVRVGDLRVRGFEGCQAHAESVGDGGEGVAALDHIGWSGRRGAARNRDDLSGKDAVRVGDLRVRGLEGCQAHAESVGDGGEGVAALDHIVRSGRRGAARNRDDLSGKDAVRVGDLRVRGLEGCQAHAESVGDGGEGVAALDHIVRSGRRGAARNRDDLSGKDAVRVGDLRVRADQSCQGHPEPGSNGTECVPGVDDIFCHHRLLPRRSGPRVPSRWRGSSRGLLRCHRSATLISDTGSDRQPPRWRGSGCCPQKRRFCTGHLTGLTRETRRAGRCPGAGRPGRSGGPRTGQGPGGTRPNGRSSRPRTW